MTDEQDVRDLLSQAAELPDSVQPPVGRLIERGRAKRTRRAVLSAACAAVVVAAAATLPSVLSGAVRGPAAHHVPPPYGLIGPLAPPGPGPSLTALSRFHWSALPRSPLRSTQWPLLAWTGKDLIELSLPALRNVGSPGYAAAFNMATRTWRQIAPVPSALSKTYTLEKPTAVSAPFPNLSLVAAWTGRALFVTNYQIGPGLRPGNRVPAGLYDPATNRWTLTAMPPAMSNAAGTLAAVWTGRDIVVAGSTTAGRIDAAAYNPATRRWTMISPNSPAGHPEDRVTMVMTSNRLILLAEWFYYHGRHTPFVRGVDVMAMDTTGHWTTVTGVGWPQYQYVESPVFTGSAILVSPSLEFCKFCGIRLMPGFIANSTTLRHVTLPPGPFGGTTPTYYWTGRAVLAVNVNNNGIVSLPEGEMALYNPVTGRWSSLPTPPGNPSMAVPPLWTGTQLVELKGGSGRMLSFHR